MRVEYVCHACVLIDTGDLKIVIDPWFKGPAYCGQWNVFPKPVNTSALSGTDVILLSHGHEDHLHAPPLGELPKRARVFYPYNWYGGTKDYLQSMGFDDVREAITYKTYRLSPQTSLSYISNNLDSIIVIESGGRVLVNVNDALHAYPKEVVDFYLNARTQRWPRIDTLLCGFGGASYFPNTVHLEGKDDGAIGAAREQLFAHNFCRITRGFKPRVAVPFAADFALLAPRQHWTNEVRFPRTHMKAYYREHFAVSGGDTREPEIYDMYPGDALNDDELEATSPYRAELHVFDRKTIEAKLDSVCVRLLTRHPTAKGTTAQRASAPSALHGTQSAAAHMGCQSSEGQARRERGLRSICLDTANEMRSLPDLRPPSARRQVRRITLILILLRVFASFGG